MLAEIKVYNSSSELQEDMIDIKSGCQGSNKTYLLLSKEKKDNMSTAYVVTKDGINAHRGKNIGSLENVPRMLIIPTEDNTYGRDHRGCPTENEPYSRRDQIHTYKKGTVEYYTGGHTLEGDVAHNTLLKKGIFAGSIPDLLDYLGMPEESSETDSVQRELGIDFVK